MKRKLINIILDIILILSITCVIIMSIAIFNIATENWDCDDISWYSSKALDAFNINYDIMYGNNKKDRLTHVWLRVYLFGKEFEFNKWQDYDIARIADKEFLLKCVASDKNAITIIVK